jgi:hypothetical protein
MMDLHPSVPAQFVGWRGALGQGTHEYQRSIEAMETMARHRDRYINFAVLDDTAAPAFRSGDMLVLDIKRSAFIDGAYYVLDFDKDTMPLMRSDGMPLKFYPSVYLLSLSVAGVNLQRGNAPRETIPRSQAERCVIGRVVCGFRMHGSID